MRVLGVELGGLYSLSHLTTPPVTLNEHISLRVGTGLMATLGTEQRQLRLLLGRIGCMAVRTVPTRGTDLIVAPALQGTKGKGVLNLSLIFWVVGMG